MIKNIFLILIGFLWSVQLSGQNNFEYAYNDSLSSFRVSGAAELANGNYVLSSTKYNVSSEAWDVFVFLLDSEGDLLQSVSYQHPDYELISAGLFVKSDTSFLLLALANNTSSSVLWVGHFANSLDMISEKLFDYPFPKIEMLNGKRETDSTLIFSGWLEGFIPYGAKLNFVGNHLEMMGYVNVDEPSLDILPRSDSSGYLLLADYNFYLTDSDFMISQIVGKVGTLNGNLIKGFDDNTYIYTQKKYYGNPDSTAFFVSKIRSDDLSVLKTDLLADTLDQSLVYAAPKKSLAKNANSLYVGGIKDFTFPVSKPSKLVLGKYDNQLNKVWEKDYGKDNMFYFMNGVIATSDGGCLMYGYRVKYMQSYMGEVYVLKVDENGLITGETIIPVLQQVHIYPNPAMDYIQFDLPKSFESLDVELIDMSGRIVLTQKITHQEQVDISSLPKGMYGWRLMNRIGELISMGKLLKE